MLQGLFLYTLNTSMASNEYEASVLVWIASNDSSVTFIPTGI